MLSKIIVLIQVIIVVQTITVPPIWPKPNADILHASNIPLPTQYTNVQSKINPLQNYYVPASQQVNSFRTTHNNYQSNLPFAPNIQPQSTIPNLQYRLPVNREVYIYHPKLYRDTHKKRPVEINRPASFQIVNFDNQAKDITIRHKTELNNHPVRNLEISRGKSYGRNVRLENRTDKTIHNVNTKNNKFEAPVSVQEFPRDVPTKPIYPGEGQWAKPQLRHKPYIDNRKQAPAHRQNENEKNPEGYDIFEQGQEQFQRAQNKFHHDLDTFPQKHNLKLPQIDDENRESPPLYEKPEIGFVPQKLYAQVRRTETEQHLPRSSIDPEEEENASRLREVIKDSKIHTVYTEEGYEDSSYDHAGHEKHAENSEEHSQLSDDQSTSLNGHGGNRKNKYFGNGENEGKRNFERRRLKDEEGDSDEQNDESVNYEKYRKIEPDNNSESTNTNDKITTTVTEELPTKNIMKVKMQTRNKGDIDMEIHTEVKYVPGPQKKKHKFVKIIPSYQKHVDLRKNNKTENYMVNPLRRVKRYDKNELSKRYERKRPNYYWKKIKTSTTERPLLNMRRKFEAAFKSYNRSFRTTTTNTPLDDNSTTKSIIATSAFTPTSTTTTTTAATIISTTPIPPPTPPLEDFQEQQKEIIAKGSKVDIPKVKIRKYVVKRQKRYTIDHPNIDIDLKEFVDVKKISNPTTRPDLTFVKYPYYKLPVTNLFNEYSPLRYAEDMKTIPKKIDDLSFYESRSHIECPEVETNVDPIPERVGEQEDDDETNKSDEEPDLPRLRGLGDKIDCLKIKYFGENPLDSPFFQEENIHAPIPLHAIKNINIDNINNVKVTSDTNAAKDIYYKTRKYDNNVEINEKINGGTKNNTDNVKLSPEKLQSNKNYLSATRITFDRAQNEFNHVKKRELKIKILEPIVVVNEGMFQTATINPIHQKSDAVLKPPYTLLEMMNMNLKKLKPKSIYDQITLLEEENDEQTFEKPLPLTEKFIVIYENENVNMKNTSTEHPLEKKIKTIKPAINGYKSPKISDIISDLTMYSQGVEQPDIINLLNDTASKDVPIIASKTPHNIEHSAPKLNENVTPKSQKVFIRKPVQKSNRISSIKSPGSLPSEITKHKIVSSRATTPFPVSEIANSEMLQQKELIQDTITMTTSKPSSPVQKSYLQISRRSSLPYIFDITRFLPKIPNHKIITSEVHYKDEIKPSEQLRMYSDVLKTINKSKEMSAQSITSNRTFVETNEQEAVHTNLHENPTTQKNLQNLKHLQFSTIKSTIHDEHIADSTNKVIGLVPPKKKLPYSTVTPSSMNYKPKHHPALETQNAQETQNINYYYVLGLKPPPQSKTFFKIHHKRSKRHINDKQDELEDLVAEESRSYEVTPSRKPKVYTEIVRTRPAKAETEEDYEDLNPRKRIYELKAFNSATTENTINFEEVIEAEIPEKTESPTTPKPIIYPVEANSDNPNIAQYIFIVDQLHEKWEKEKPSTEPVPETTPQTLVSKPTEAMQTVAESINVPAGEPAFLQIINQLRTIQKEEENKNPPIATTNSSAVIKEISSSDPVKNSNPYILASVIPESFMSELSSMQAKLDPEKLNGNQEGSSRLRNFNAKFKTSIDTSKYKTIERSPVSFRHNLSSRYNADDQELPLSKIQTTQLPMVITSKSEEDMTKQPSEDVEAKTEGMASKAKAEIITSTTARSRQQSRSRSRPTTTATTEKLRMITISPTHRRRRPTRITTAAPITKAQYPYTRRRLRLRPESQLRSSTSETVNKDAYITTTETPKTETITKTVSDTLEDNKKQRRLQTIHERRVVSEVTLTRFFEPNSDESGISSSNENVEETKNYDQQIIGPLTYAPEELFSDSHLAKNVNQLKDDQESTASSKETISKFITTSESSIANLYPNMARMINRLAETQPDSKMTVNYNLSDEDDIENESSMEEKPLFIKDPSKRMYYYARL